MSVKSRQKLGLETPLPLALAALGAALAVVGLVITALSGPFSLGVGAGPGAGIELTALSAVLLVLIAGLGLVVQSFVGRYSIDDPRLGSLRWLLLLATVGSALVASAATLLVLAVGWLLTSAALAGLLAYRPDVPGASDTLRPALLGLAATDLCLLGAVAIVTATAGNAPLDELGTIGRDLAGARVAGIEAGALVATLLVIAALGRCAQIPFRAWLTQTIAVPTPVSALLHAGIVNAGGLLIILTATLVTSSESAMLLLYAGAATTMLYGTSLMIARPDVKGALALSTRGQMAFMLLQVAIGAYAAAIFHLVAHGMYKATLFLGAGGVVDESRTLASAPQSLIPAARGTRALRQALPALLIPVVLIALAVALVSPGLPDDAGGIILLGFAWASAAQASWWWLRLREPSGLGLALGLVALAAAVFIYVALLGGAKEILAPAIPASGDATLPAVLLAPVLALAVAATAVRWFAAGLPPGDRAARLGGLQRRLYARALSAGAWPPRRRFRATASVSRIQLSGRAGEPAPAFGSGE